MTEVSSVPERELIFFFLLPLNAWIYIQPYYTRFISLLKMMYEGHITFWKDHKRRKRAQNGKETKNGVIICENRPRFGKQNSAQKNMYFCIHRNMQLNGAHVGIRLAWWGMWPTDWNWSKKGGRSKSTSEMEFREIVKKEVFVLYRTEN